MSNHGNESTNKEGVNIDETQTKIDTGKLITTEIVRHYRGGREILYLALK
jgi:hypothetical protein